MLFAGQEGDAEYVDSSAVVEVPFKDSKIVIENFFLCNSSIYPYSIVAGIGKNGDRQFLVGRALVHGIRGMVGAGVNQTEYMCAPILDIYRETVRRDLENYRQDHKLDDAEIILWPELLLDQK